MKKIEQAVILAGGRGERLRPLTDNIPKPLAPIGGIPFLDYLMQSAVDVGIKKFLLLLGYRAEKIVERYKAISGPAGIQVACAIGNVDDATGRRLLNAYDLLEDHFLLMYGDNYWPIEWVEMTALYQSPGAKVQTTVFSNRNGTGEYGRENNVEVGRDCLVTRYDKTRRSSGLNGVDMGYFLVEKSILDVENRENLSFEEDILPRLIARRELGAYTTDTQYYFITDMACLTRFEAVAGKHNVRPLAQGRG